MFLFFALLVSTLLAARGEDHPNGLAFSGRSCFSACESGYCYSWGSIVEPCYKAQYSTAQYRHNHSLCAGPCRNLHKDLLAPTCFVDDQDWDFCNVEPKYEVVHDCSGYTQCLGQCANGSCFTSTWSVMPCNTCEHFIRAYSVYREPCLDRCEKRPGQKGLRCNVMNLFLILWSSPPTIMVCCNGTEISDPRKQQINRGTGLLIGSMAGSFFLRGLRRWPTIIGGGLGAGMAYSNCENSLNSYLMSLDPKICQVKKTP